ncbi:MAG: hypothetical protein ACRDTC_04820 [Pseudonocardiaceae bacterium]
MLILGWIRSLVETDQPGHPSIGYCRTELSPDAVGTLSGACCAVEPGEGTGGDGVFACAYRRRCGPDLLLDQWSLRE